MKHFKRIAEIGLPRAEFDLIKRGAMVLVTRLLRKSVRTIPRLAVPELFAVGNEEPTQSVSIILAAFTLIATCHQLCLDHPNGG